MNPDGYPGRTLGGTPGEHPWEPAGEPLGGSEETSGGPLRKRLVDPLGGRCNLFERRGPVTIIAVQPFGDPVSAL